jgi:hypothetical protein
MVEYSPGYRADHWCEKGHILLCLEGEPIPSSMTAAASSVARDELPGCRWAMPHRSSALSGARLLVD